MKIVVTSQNKCEVTEHAGRCRNFWIYEVVDGSISQKTLLELPKEQSFHEIHGNAHPLDDMQVFMLYCLGLILGWILLLPFWQFSNSSDVTWLTLVKTSFLER